MLPVLCRRWSNYKSLRVTVYIRVLIPRHLHSLEPCVFHSPYFAILYFLYLSILAYIFMVARILAGFIHIVHFYFLMKVIVYSFELVSFYNDTVQGPVIWSSSSFAISYGCQSIYVSLFMSVYLFEYTGIWLGWYIANNFFRIRR